MDSLTTEPRRQLPDWWLLVCSSTMAVPWLLTQVTRVTQLKGHVLQAWGSRGGGQVGLGKGSLRLVVVGATVFSTWGKAEEASLALFWKEVTPKLEGDQNPEPGFNPN